MDVGTGSGIIAGRSRQSFENECFLCRERGSVRTLVGLPAPAGNGLIKVSGCFG